MSLVGIRLSGIHLTTECTGIDKA